MRSNEEVAHRKFWKIRIMDCGRNEQNFVSPNNNNNCMELNYTFKVKKDE